MSDVIRREDALNAIKKAEDDLIMFEPNTDARSGCIAGFFKAENIIKALPSAEPSEMFKEFYEQGKYDAEVERSFAEPSGDLISREDAIEVVANMLYEEPPYLNTEVKCYKYAEKLISALPSADAVQGWIPCSERLPKEKQEVYVTVYFIEGDTGRAYGYMDGFGKWHLYSTVEGTLNSGYDVLAWMPLPMPYREEKEE